MIFNINEIHQFLLTYLFVKNISFFSLHNHRTGCNEFYDFHNQRGYCENRKGNNIKNLNEILNLIYKENLFQILKSKIHKLLLSLVLFSFHVFLLNHMTNHIYKICHIVCVSIMNAQLFENTKGNNSKKIVADTKCVYTKLLSKYLSW